MTYIKNLKFLVDVKSNPHLKNISDRINEMGQFRYNDDDMCKWIDYSAHDSDIFRFSIFPLKYKDRLNVVNDKIPFRVYVDLNCGNVSTFPHHLSGSLKSDIVLLDTNEINTLMTMSHDQNMLIQNIINMYFGTSDIRYEYLIK